ncbi:Down syndrome cell adhesion molecule-like protein Dscam2 isoform X2 [Varroa jacobsoni]|uniref:Down syndrome cell adhesion molecule-like protein Dscam2 n=1 Tax=Varroa destructor TaxID=109461 RepID=A0A7M7JVX2_VARDE|nr:Down syndrome cell adhesion molecule-like protein Dscam2 isoform X3 [Varroa destructor]XP_022687982.1 Down syndrome cell adhesion molecule-like protein Dscam2 isoform X2 [Varroa jacobsoni]
MEDFNFSTTAAPRRRKMKALAPGVLLLLIIKVNVAWSMYPVERGPTFVLEPPSSMEFSSDTGAVVPCSAQGQPSPQVRWEKRDGTPAGPIAGVRDIRPDGSLLFHQFKVTQFRPDVHATAYRCVAYNHVGLIKSRLVQIKGVVAHQFTASVFDAYAVRGNSALLRCHVATNVREFVRVSSWTRQDGVTVGTLGDTGLDKRYVMLSSGELLIRLAKPADSAHSFKCTLHNVLTGQSTVSQNGGKIIVTEANGVIPVKITEYRSSVHVEEGDRAYLPCISQGHPTPTSNWYRTDSTGALSPVLPSDRFQLLEGVLIISSSSPSDSGRYVCMVNNSAGEERAQSDLYVTVPLIARVEPNIQVVDVGRTANMSCRISGQPVHSVVWTKDGQPLSKSPRFNLLTTDILQVLEISPVHRQDRGMYQCQVANAKDSAQGTAQLIIGEDAPVLEHAFRELTLKPGSMASLKCSASGNPLPQITWTLDGQPVPEVYHIRIGDYVSGERSVHSYVNITAVRVEDGGVYTCAARNGVGRAEHSARLQVHGKPHIRAMAPVTALAGRTVHVHCPAAGYPLKSIHWIRDNRTLPQNHRQKTFDNGTLVIADVERRTDDGQYTCVVTGDHNVVVSKQLKLTVMIPPIVNPFTFPEDLTQGKRAGAACIVSDGDLPIRIAWLKDGQPLPSSLKASISAANDYTSFLSFTSVDQLHSGNYTCVATNPAAASNYTAPMVVQVPPRWLTEPLDRHAIVGEPIVFDCQASGHPLPVIRWKKQQKSDFAVIISNANIQILENGSLSIREVSREDAGPYMCQAVNGVGPGISKVINLDVHVAAHFERKFQALTVRRGDSFQLNCRAIGEPPLVVTWTRDRQPFSPNLEPRYVVQELNTKEVLEYKIHVATAERRDSSLFSCYAENAFGRDDTNFQVVVQEPPEKPREVDVASVSSRSATLTWQHPYSGNSPIIRYILEFKKSKASWEIAQASTVETAEPRVVVTSLRPKSEYEIRLKAENALGMSEPSQAVTVTTDEEAPNSVPRNIKISPIGSSSLHVIWDAPESGDDGPASVQGYYVGYKASGKGGESFAYKTLDVSELPSGQPLETNIRELKKSTKYVVVVQAFNSKGAGPVSDEVLAQTLEIDPPPAANLKLVSSTSSSVHLAWNIAREQPINGYTVFYRDTSGSGGPWQENFLPAEKASHIVRGLSCGRPYVFYVVAHNGAGKGPHSNHVQTKTDGATPVAPTSIREFLSSNTTCISVDLSSWKSGGCPISTFVLHYRLEGDSDWTNPGSRAFDASSSSTTQHPVTLCSLAHATWYTLLVAAHNEAGATETEYPFSTLTLQGGTIPPPHSTRDRSPPYGSVTSLILPFIVSLVLLVTAAVGACFWFGRMRGSRGCHPRDQGDSSKCLQHCNQDTLPMAVWEKMEANKHASMQYMQSPCHGQGTIRRAPGDASRGFYGGDTLGPGGVGIGIPREWRGDEHTYDVPFHRQQMPGHHQGTLHHGVTMHHQNQAGQGQYQMAGQLPAQNSNQLNHVCDTAEVVLIGGNGEELRHPAYLYSKPKRKSSGGGWGSPSLGGSLGGSLLIGGAEGGSGSPSQTTPSSSPYHETAARREQPHTHTLSRRWH